MDVFHTMESKAMEAKIPSVYPPTTFLKGLLKDTVSKKRKKFNL